MPKIKIHNEETNQVIEREMNTAELAQYEADQAEQAAKVQEEIKVQATKAALLKRLGITADEAALLLA